MYWSDNNSKSIETLLGQEGVTLEAVLNEDDVLQECMGQNSALLNFLQDDKNLTEMLSVIINEPPETSGLERFKHPNTVCEILTYNNNPFAEIIAGNAKYMSQLWSFVSADTSNESPSDSTTQPLNPLLASFFTKVFLHLFTHQIDPVLDFLTRLEPPNDLVSVILRHINTSAIMDLIYKSWECINIEKKNNPEIAAKYNDLLQKNGFIEKLINIFGDKTADLKQQNAANLISDLVKTGRELLTHHQQQQQQQSGSDDGTDKVDGILEQFEQTKVSQSLLQNMFASQTKHSIASGLKIIQDLLVYRIQMQQLIHQQKEQLSSMSNGRPDVQDVNEAMPTFLKSNSSPSSGEVQFMPPQLSSPVDVHGEHLARCVRNVSVALHERLEDFVALLTNPAGLTPINTTVGLIKCPLGLIRLEVIHLFVALFATSDYSILEKCSQLHVLKLLTDLFFEYSLNNQLHKYYEQIIEYLFQNYSTFKIIYDKHSANEVLYSQPSAMAIDAAPVTPPAPADTSETSSTESSTNDGEEALKKAQDQSSEQPQSTTPNSNGTSTPPNSEKILYFIKLYEISKVLVKQVIVDCRLLERILESFAPENVPVKSQKQRQADMTTTKPVEEPVAPPTPEQESVSSTMESNEPIDDSGNSTGEVKMEVDQDTQSVPADAVAPSESTLVNGAEKEEATSSVTAMETDPAEKPPLLQTLRPGYMGHLRLIANVLKDRCTNELLEECELSAEVVQNWNEFKTGKLLQLNELINSKLVEESKFNENSDVELFQRYQIEATGQNLAMNINMFANDFGQSSLGDANQQLKISDAPEFDFDKYWTNSNEKLNDFEKYFDEKCSSIFDDDDEEAFNREADPLGVDLKRDRPVQLIATMQEDFATFADDPFVSKNDDSKGEADSGFANFDQMNTNTSPWGEEVPAAQAEPSEGAVTTETIQSPQWSADFSNDPFSASDAPSSQTELFEGSAASISPNSPQKEKETPLEQQ